MSPEFISMLKEHLDSEDKSNNFDPAIYDTLVKLSGELGLYSSVRSANRIDIGDFTQQDFYLAFELDKTGLIIAYFVFRSSSWTYDGERTDIHDTQSLLFSLCCATNNYSVSLWDVTNGFSQIEEELYGRYATISQPNHSVITQDESGLKHIKSILSIYKDYQRFLLAYKCQSSSVKSYCWNIEEIESQTKKFADILGVDISEVFGNRRTQPDWDYYKAHSQRISVIKTPLATKMFEKHVLDTVKSTKKLVDDEIIYLKHTSQKNCFSSAELLQIKELISSFTESNLKIIATESHIFAIGGEWIVSKHGDFGFERFKLERETFSGKVLKKVNFLFENGTFSWNAKGCPERFENLCRDLLAREPLVSRVRKVSPTNQPDRSRDLIAEIIEYKPTDAVIHSSAQPLDINRYLVQCKLTSKTLGIPSGMGPIEALYLGNYNGYFLITNSILSSDHTALLEKIRSDDKYHADWWLKDDIEERLKINIDLLYKYDDLVSYSTLTSGSRK